MASSAAWNFPEWTVASQVASYEACLVATWIAIADVRQDDSGGRASGLSGRVKACPCGGVLVPQKVTGGTLWSKAG